MTEYAIVGPGALGLLWAARLSKRRPVSLWGRQGAVSGAFSLAAAGEPETPVIIPANPLLTPDIALITTKSYDALPALNAAVEHWGRRPRAVVLFQNGIRSQEEIAAAFDTVPVMAASTTEGANRRPEGNIVHAGRGETALGLLSAPAIDANTGWLDLLVRDFSNAGFATHQVEDIRAALWQKLLINAGINGFTVLLDAPNGDLENAPLFEEHIGPLSQELALVSRTQGLHLPADAIESRIRAVIRTTAANISSMLQDVRAGRKTEIDYINGAIVQLGAKHGLATPVNRMLWDRVKALSAK